MRTAPLIVSCWTKTDGCSTGNLGFPEMPEGCFRQKIPVLEIMDSFAGYGLEGHIILKWKNSFIPWEEDIFCLSFLSANNWILKMPCGGRDFRHGISLYNRKFRFFMC